MKRKLLAGVLAIATAVALVGINSTGVSAQQPAKTWSVAVHIEYPDGFVYDHAFVSGVPASELNTYLQACGQSHRDQNWLRLHCYVIPD
jgi:hypothetical protein